MWTSKRPWTKDSERFDEEVERPDTLLVIPAKNFIIGALPSTEAQKLIDSLRPVRLEAGDELYQTGDEIPVCYFPIDCTVSSLALLEDGSTVEISMTGREGLVGLSAIVGGGRSIHWTRVSATGVALCASRTAVQEHFERSDPIQRAILHAYRLLFTQVCQRSVCNTRHPLLQRLSLWLLMMHDRLGSDALPFTQEEIAGRISVRRAGVSVAASMLQSMHAISYHRGKIVIIDRPVLERSVCECYRILGQEFHADDEGGGLQTSYRR